jgi:hypothetical protein
MNITAIEEVERHVERYYPYDGLSERARAVLADILKPGNMPASPDAEPPSQSRRPLRLSLEEFGWNVRDFLREWNLGKKNGRDLVLLVAEEPRYLRGLIAGGEVCDAFLGALGKHLGEAEGLTIPQWVDDPRRSLVEPWFSLDSEAAKTWLRREALPRFKEKNLFVDSSALARL